jgi:hypothetical protein
MEKIHCQIKLSDVGKSDFKRLVVLCTDKEREDRALQRKMLIASRKRVLEARKNQLDKLFAVRYTTKVLFGGLFITAFIRT